MKVLLDTNILVDFLAKRPQFFNTAQIIIRKCKNEEITGGAAVHTISTLFYILKNIFRQRIYTNFFTVYSQSLK